MSSNQASITSPKSPESNLDSNVASTGGTVSGDINEVVRQNRASLRRQDPEVVAARIRRQDAVSEQEISQKRQTWKYLGVLFYSVIIFGWLIALLAFVALFIPDLRAWAQNVLTTILGAVLGAMLGYVVGAKTRRD